MTMIIPKDLYAYMIFRVKWVPWSLDIIEGTPPVKISLVAGKAGRLQPIQKTYIQQKHIDDLY